MRKFGNKQSTPIILEMPIMPIMPPRGMDRSNFSDGVGQVRGGIVVFGKKRRNSKEVKRIFDEKRV